MNITKLAELLSALLGEKVYSINFPEYTKGEFIKLETTSGMIESGGVMDFTIQLMFKANHPSTAEKMAIDSITNLNMVTNKLFDDDKFQLILCRADSPQAHYVGESKVGEYVFSADFRLLVTRV